MQHLLVYIFNNHKFDKKHLNLENLHIRYDYLDNSQNILAFIEKAILENVNIPYDFSWNTPNKIAEDLIKKSLKIYLEYSKPNWNLMSPADRKYCRSIIQQFAPELLHEIS